MNYSRHNLSSAVGRNSGTPRIAPNGLHMRRNTAEYRLFRPWLSVCGQRGKAQSHIRSGAFLWRTPDVGMSGYKLKAGQFKAVRGES